MEKTFKPAIKPKTDGIPVEQIQEIERRFLGGAGRRTPPTKTTATAQEKDQLYPMREELAKKQREQPPPRPIHPPPQNVRQFENDLLSKLGNAENFDLDLKDNDLTSPIATTALKTPPSLTKSVEVAQDRIKKEDKAYDDEKIAGKAEKLGDQIRKQMKKATELTAEEKGILDKIVDSVTDIFKEEPKKEKNRIVKAQDVEKANKEIDAVTKMPLTALAKAGVATTAVTKGLKETILTDDLGDNIATAAGSVATSSAAVAQNLLQAFQSFSAYSKTDGAAADQNLSEALNALGGAVGNLINLTRNTLNLVNVADPTGGEVAGAIPILGCVAAVPTLLAEINDLRSAVTRLTKQKMIHEDLKKNHPEQAALDTTLKSLMAIDKEAIGKGVANIILDFTKIAGHAVTAGGVTGPAGVAMSTGASVMKIALQAVGGVENLVDAHHANEARKKLAGKKPGAETEDQKDKVSGKLIKRDPQLAAQSVIEQALLEIAEGGGPAVNILKSFGIEEKQLQECVAADVPEATVIANIREMRQKMLYKLAKDDETAQTATQKFRDFKKMGKDYFSMPTKHKELGDYMDAKNMIGEITGEDRMIDRGTGWQVKMDVLIGDYEDEKKKLNDQVEYLLKKGSFNENDEVNGKKVLATLRDAAVKLKPKEEKGKETTPQTTAPERPQTPSPQRNKPQNPTTTDVKQEQPVKEWTKFNPKEKKELNTNRTREIGKRLQKQSPELQRRLSKSLLNANALNSQGENDQKKLDESKALLEEIVKDLEEVEAQSTNAWADDALELAQDVEALGKLGDAEIAEKADVLLEKLRSLPENTDLTEINTEFFALQLEAKKRI